MSIPRYSHNEPEKLPAPFGRGAEGLSTEPIPYAEPTPYVRVQAPGSAPDSLSQYWALLMRRKWLISGSAALGLTAGILISKLTTPQFRAGTSVEVQNLNEDFMNMKSVNPTAPLQGFQSPEYNIRTQTAILQSKPVVARTLAKLDLEKRILEARETNPGPLLKLERELNLAKPAPAPTHDETVAMAMEAMKVKAQPTTRVIDVTFDSPDPRIAADFANSLVLSFMEQNLEQRLETSRKTTEWLTQQMQEVKVKLKASEDQLQAFAQRHGLVILAERDNVAEERLRQLQTELTKAQTERQSRQSRYELVASARPETLPEVLDDQALKEYQKELTDLRRQLAEFSSMYTPEHPKIEKLQAQIVTLQTALDKKRADILARIKNEFDSARRRETLLTNEYGAQTGIMSKQSDKLMQYLNLKREVDTNRQLYDSMFQKAKEAGMASSLRASDAHVIEPATPPAKPFKPNLPLNTALGLLTGLCAGIALAVSRPLDRNIEEPGDLAFHLNLPELGVVPMGKPELLRLGSGKKSDGVGLAKALPALIELTTWNERLSAVAESFRVILTSILFSEPNGVSPRVIVLSSANPGEGKTTVISNLAIALAQASRRVLLVDGDMRRPRLHGVFEVDNSVGLSEALAGNAALSIHQTKVPNLSLLTSGQSMDVGLLFTPQVRQLLRRLRNDFDAILIDTPPILQTSDARILGRYADAVVLVVAQHTLKEDVYIACQKLAEDGSAILGTVLNNWNPKKSTSGYARYQGYYKSY